METKTEKDKEVIIVNTEIKLYIEEIQRVKENLQKETKNISNKIENQEKERQIKLLNELKMNMKN